MPNYKYSKAVKTKEAFLNLQRDYPWFQNNIPVKLIQQYLKHASNNIKTSENKINNDTNKKGWCTTCEISIAKIRDTIEKHQRSQTYSKKNRTC